MSWNNRVVWSEGMFIGTQHFQQHDRYLENLIDARSRPLSAGAWGRVPRSSRSLVCALLSYSLGV